VIRQIDVQYEFMLLGLLPLGKTQDRSFNIFTAYDSNTRQMTLAVQNYPGSGLDTFFVATINADVTGATPVVVNKIIAHPDTAPNNPGSMSLSKIFLDPKGNLLTLFNDGTLYDLDLSGGKFNLAANINSGGAVKNSVPTTAHVMDGTTLNSFIYDSARNTPYLIQTDMSVSPFKVSAPLMVQPIKGMLGKETPFAAHMIKTTSDGVPQLSMITYGNFDTISLVDNATGEQTPWIASFSDNSIPCQLECNSATKDCDMWGTSAYDPIGNKLYLQCHTTDDMDTAMWYSVGLYQTAGRPEYPIMSSAVNAPLFGYSSYQWVTMPAYPPASSKDH